MTQKAAVTEANRRRRASAGRLPDVPWPRKEGGTDLPYSTVNDWFPKNGSKQPSVPPDFEDLWSVVRVMLDWTGRFHSRQAEITLRQRWRQLHEEAQRPTGLDTEVLGYLEAARKAAERHPYPGFVDLIDPPPLAEVYVRQSIWLTGQDAHSGHPTPPSDLDSTDRPALAGLGDQLPEPHPLFGAQADRRLIEDEEAGVADQGCREGRKPVRLSLLIAGAGGGKSTLLRTLLREVADEWLLPTRSATRPPSVVPIWVSARALAGDETQVPKALATATRKLSRYGRHPELSRTRFLERPCSGAYWLLLVDDLDELPDAQERRAVLEKLVNAVTQDPPLYQCVVASRPLSGNELAAAGSRTKHHTLRPFTPEDVHTYVEKYFGTRWPRKEATSRARQFADALHAASLSELARTPLMSFMLCQLYLARPERSLPGGRTAIYTEFAELLYANNQHKRVAESHEEAIRHLVDGQQNPQARKDVRTAAEEVCARLPELINCLAHEWRTEPQTSVLDALASHEAVRRPIRVRPERWGAFLEDLLQHTGLLAQHADGLGFPHQSFLEYHAACHATRDEQARAELLHDLPLLLRAGRGQRTQRPLDDSYVGFLLDGLLVPCDHIAAEALRTMELVIASGGEAACEFLMQQVHLRTCLPSRPTVSQLARFADDHALDADIRLRAAETATQLDTQTGVVQLARLAHDNRIGRSWQVSALKALARVDEEAGIAHLLRFINDPTLRGFTRVSGALVMARLDRVAGATELVRLIDDTMLYGLTRSWAAETLARVDEQAGTTQLIRLINDQALDGDSRVDAAKALVRVNEEAGTAQLAQLSTEPTLDGLARVRAAKALAWTDKRAATAQLTRLTTDSSLDEAARAWASEVLARVQKWA